MLRAITLNLNGVRSAASKGAFAWLARSRADVICVQELKAQERDLAALAIPRGFSAYYHCARKRGYSGVGIYARRMPDRVQCGLGIEDIDAEGRYLQADFGTLSVISVYLPSGSSSPERQAVKFRFMERFFPHLARLRAGAREVLLCGDWNIAHREIDLKNWRANQKNSGFLPEERTWLTRVFDELGFVDVFRRLDHRPERYTWWSNRGQARAKNVGWRIDYQIATPGLAATARAATIYTRKRFSDHAPLTIDFEHAH
ncbi:MAG: exodeoxyribonuclease III [Burkholderiales bacterium]|nr:exodeoxyribonuclease III [Burkholderiales bacterium]